FYASVRQRAEGIDSALGRQKIILELYDKFFRSAFPRLTEKLGIVYTPVEVVDFILRAVDQVLQQEFGYGLGAEHVHILDPFTGTGTFMTRLLQSGLIPMERLKAKYQYELHANEIVLLAYYIAAINIESVVHDLLHTDYTAFPGICLTDTFILPTDKEPRNLYSGVLAVNSGRIAEQSKQQLRVIIGNPPYSAGQRSANDNNANVEYPHLDARITETYADQSTAGLNKSLYDSYIRAIRW
ncbi:hypothetical protein TI04_13510, partial [Achromatium sp. WMS2]